MHNSQDPRDRVYNEGTVSEDMLEFLQAFLEGAQWREALQHLSRLLFTLSWVLSLGQMSTK